MKGLTKEAKQKSAVSQTGLPQSDDGSRQKLRGKVYYVADVDHVVVKSKEQDLATIMADSEGLQA